MMDIFCKIVSGEIASNKIYEDGKVIVILDLNPRSNGHSLIIPKKHYDDIYDVDEDILNHMFKVARDINKLCEKKLHSNGASFEINYGIAQEVKHIHLHIIPRYKYEDIADPKEIYKVLQS
ncbi:MAG: HIT domain-containing protein [Bacilli bacterium]|nr:HIT domain-containing protein [Bacilli bacterium]